MTVVVPRVIRTSSRRMRMRPDGSVYVYTHQVLEVPATELTWTANCAVIAAELATVDYDIATVSEVCKRILGLDEGSFV
jgi:hypothetical protein